MKPLDCRWTDMLSRHLSRTPIYPHYTAGSTYQSQSCFSLVTLQVTVQRNGTPLLFQWWPCGRVSPWVGGTVLLQWTHPQTRGYLLSPQHVILLVEHCWKAGDFPAPGSCTWIINSFMLSALILPPTLVVDWPIRQTARHLLIWAEQMFFDGMPSSFPRLRAEAPSFSVRERLAFCKSWSHFWNRNQMTMIDCSPSIIPKI